MKKKAAVLLLFILLFLTACTAEQSSTESLTETEPETTSNVTDTETKADTITETETVTETETETEPETETETETEEETNVFVPEPEKTNAPSVKGWTLTEPGMAMIYGECENNSKLTVKTELEEYEAFSDGVYFAVYAALNEKGETEVSVSACADGKTKSDNATVTVKNNRGADDTGVAVTLGSRVVEKKVLPDQYGTNGFSEGNIDTIKDAVRYRLKKAEKAAGKPVQLVYIIVPDPLTVYPEELTQNMRDRIESPNLRLKQSVQALSGIDGVTVIDLTEALKNNKEIGKLYYKLDSHWTELGAFYGYAEVMSILGLQAHTLSDYRVDYIDIDDTDMNVYSGVSTGEMYESAPFLSALFEEKTPYGANHPDTARIWDFGYEFFINQSTKTKANENGPSALMLFDSYGFNIIPYLAESFGVFYTQPVWRYSVDYSVVSEIKPDYIIELLAERNLDELLSAT